MWTLIDTSMHKMTLNVPRTMYVDVTAGSMHLLESSARFAGAVRKVDRTLPDGSAPEALLELELPEEDFVQDHNVRATSELTINKLSRTAMFDHVCGCASPRRVGRNAPACMPSR